MNLTVEQIENILIDTGVIYLDYGLLSERILAPTRGGNGFVVEQEIKNIERDGARGKEKGMRRVIREDATLTVRPMGLSQENLKLALAGANVDAETGEITNGDGTIPDSDYLTNVALVGETLGGDTKVITIYNALGDNGLSVNTVDKDEVVVEIAFAAHYNPQDLTEPLYKIGQVEGSDTYTVTFTVEDDGTPISGATVNFDGRSLATNGSGVAVFVGVGEGSNQAFSVLAGGFQTYFGSVTVDGDDEALTVTMTAI